MVVSTSMSSACLSSLLLGSFMCTLVLFCRKYSLNPGTFSFIPYLLMTANSICRQHRSAYRRMFRRSHNALPHRHHFHDSDHICEHTYTTHYSRPPSAFFGVLRSSGASQPIRPRSDWSRMVSLVRRNGHQHSNWNYSRPVRQSLQRLCALGCSNQW